jgi:hypothetical protein
MKNKTENECPQVDFLESTCAEIVKQILPMLDGLTVNQVGIVLSNVQREISNSIKIHTI